MKKRPPVRKPEKKHAGGRPRELPAHIAFNVRLPVEVWAALRSRAARRNEKMSDTARIALAEWLLACELGQRPAHVNEKQKEGA